MTKIHGARAIVKCLEREGIEIVFGIPGLCSMPIFDALYRHPTIKVVTVRHEQGAAFMADGYARATGKIAAIITLPGPLRWILAIHKGNTLTVAILSMAAQSP